MLPQNNRLSRSDFDLVYKQGRRVRGESIGLAYLLTEKNSEQSKVGIIVSKKVSKKATDRNKLKRQIRAVLIKDVLKTLPAGYKVVLTAFPAPKTKKYNDIKEEILDLFQKIV